MTNLLILLAAVAATVAWVRVAFMINGAIKRRNQIHFLTNVLRPHLLQLRDGPTASTNASPSQLSQRPVAAPVLLPNFSTDSSVCA